MWGYWKRVFGRAFRDSVAFLGWGDWKRLVIRTVQFFAAVGGMVLLGWVAQATDKLVFWVAIAAASAGAFPLTFVARVIATPYRLDLETRNEVTALQRQLEARRRSEESGQLLRALHDEGQQLLDPSLDGWFGRVCDWYARADRLVAEHLPPSEAFMFTSLSPKLHQMGPMAIGTLREHLSTSLGKLRMMVGRALEGS